MLTDALPQLLNFVDQFLTCYLIKVFVRNASSRSLRSHGLLKRSTARGH